MCSGGGRDADVAASFAAGASDYVLKDYPSMLVAALRRHVGTPTGDSSSQSPGMQLLVDVVQKLTQGAELKVASPLAPRAGRTMIG